MHVYNFVETKYNLGVILEQAFMEGGVQINGENGQVFMLTPLAVKKSPLDIESVKLNLTDHEIVDFIQEGRKL